ncbi:MAG: HEAT repeat domain-containing protein, partial [Chloroflexi bacterium]|nr:HEAT repeat domain-containing protein [Chloroflexota bacterium]
LAPEGRAQLIVPLAVRPGGGMILESTQVNAYNPTAMRFVESLVDVAAIALVQEQLQTQLADRDSRISPQAEDQVHALEQANQTLQKQLGRLEHLAAIRHQLAHIPDLEAGLSRALPLVLETADLPFSGATVLVFDAAANSLVPQVTVGYRARPFKLDENLAWQCMSQKQAIQVSQLDGSAVALPLMTAHEFLGVLLLVATVRRHLDQDEIDYLNAIAQEATQSVARSRLYQDLEQQSDKLANLLLSREEDMGQLRPILDSMPVGVLVADPGGSVTLHNDLAPRTLEISGHLLGKNIHALCGLTNAEGELLPQAAPLLDFQAVWQRLELTEHIAELSLAPILATDGALLGYLAVIRDASEEVRRARLRTEFLSTVSHQLYGPLTSISGYQSLVLEGEAGPLTDESREYLQVAQDNCVRLTRLLDRLLDLTVLERAALPIETAPVNLAGVLDLVLADYQDALTQKDLALVVKVPEDLPLLQSNEQRLAQVLSTLVANAIDYNEPEGEIEIVAQVTEGVVQIDVTDTGMGIGADDQTHIFSQFFRTSQAEHQRPQGTGLSLALSKALIELQGGRIWFRSDGQPGHGSTFSFTLPIAGAVDESRTIEALTSGARRSQKILVVDDEPDIARLVAYYLDQAGYQVEQAADGHAALDVAHRARPDLILTDISMPGLDGYALIQQLRADPATATIPVIVMSVLTSDTHGLRLGTVGYVNKPLNRQQLLETVDAALLRVEQMLLISRDEPFLDELSQLLGARGYRLLVAHDDRQVRAYAGHQDLKLALLDKRAGSGLGAVGDLILDWLSQYPESPPVAVVVDDKDPALEEYLLVQGANAVLVNPADRETLASQLETLTVVASYYRDLVQATGDDDPYLRWRAIEALAQAPTGEVLGYLVDALRDPNAYVRLNTIDILDRMGDARIALPVVGCLADEDPRVVARAAEVLGKVGDTRSVETLIARLSHDEAAVRIKIVEALGLLGDSRALSPLLNTLADQDTRVRWNAVYALGRLGNLEVVDALLRALQDPDSGVRSRAVAALSMITERGEKELDPQVAETVIEALIAAMQDPSKDVQERAVEALGIVGDERAIFPLRRLSTDQERRSGTMLPELARLAIRQIRERSRKRGRQWGADAALADLEENGPAGAVSAEQD